MEQLTVAERIARAKAEREARERAQMQATKQTPPEPAKEPAERKTAKPASKKHNLGKLPREWRDMMLQASFGANGKAKKLTHAVAVLYATGCRPAELEKGVKIMYDKAKNELVVRIAGAKNDSVKYKDADGEDATASRGLAWRRLRLDPDLNDATKLLKELALRSNDVVEVQHNRDSLRVQVGQIGKVLTASLQKKSLPSISPYSFRHALGSDLKSCDQLEDVDIAKFMGHAAVDSIANYGKRRRGGKGVKPFKSVEASAEPRGGISHMPPAARGPSLSFVTA